MVTQSLPHPAPPPMIPPALPAGSPNNPSHPPSPPPSDTAVAAHSNALATATLPDEGVDAPLALTASMTRMPVSLQVTVPVRDFRVKHLLAMTPGEVIESHWANGDDLPLSSGEVQLAWTEFEVVDNRLAVRITRLA